MGTVWSGEPAEEGEGGVRGKGNGGGGFEWSTLYACVVIG
jgi:hypothetical protein